MEDVVEKLIIGIQEEVGKASEALDEMHKTKEYLKFIQERMLMHQILSAESIRHIDEILSEIALFRQILKSLQESFGQVRVLNELKKYRGFSFTKFMQETEPYL